MGLRNVIAKSNVNGRDVLILLTCPVPVNSHFSLCLFLNGMWNCGLTQITAASVYTDVINCFPLQKVLW